MSFSQEIIGEVENMNLGNILGEGRYGIVFKGTWDNKRVAVKRIQLLHIASNKQEEEALQRLDHPNVIKLLHTKSDVNFKYYYLELCNASLEKLFLKDENPAKYRGPMPPSLTVLYQLALGLEYIHKMELVHRDLKPENVLIWVDPIKRKVRMKWADFGLSKRVNERGSYSMSGIRGTYEWLAPEILRLLDDEESVQAESGTKSTNRGTIQSDVFSEGLVFGYFLSDGVHLFGSRLQIQSNMIENNPVNIDKVKSKYIRDLILEMLKDNGVERKTSQEVVESLKKIDELQNQMFYSCSHDTNPSLEKVKEILQQGVDVNCTNEEGMTLLHSLAKNKDIGHDIVKIVQHLIQHGIKVNCKDDSGNSFLSLLCENYKKGNLIDIIRILIVNGIEINCKNKYGSNALLILCQYYGKKI